MWERLWGICDREGNYGVEGTSLLQTSSHKKGEELDQWNIQIGNKGIWLVRTKNEILDGGGDKYEHTKRACAESQVGTKPPTFRKKAMLPMNLIGEKCQKKGLLAT